ncbi:deaminase [Tenacibaculum tangerinum]|uniref:Deaminase n=1 Tax=Tenacibaculum tangerinum TaxID=3038772 RepID=A0ABY8L427_9FLAO|nr:deaminase [Tenacibaculum tangerinum]WGH74645.1 deaminase [Tenacibaculum tangerinum]
MDEILDVKKITKNFEELDNFRINRKLPKYSIKDGTTGTTAKVEVNNQSFFGINSSFVPESLDLRRKWFNKIKWVPPKKKQPKHLGQAQALTHAEAHSLMNAHEKFGKLPKKIVMYVDRPTCNMCKGELPALMKTMGIDELIIFSGDKKIPLILKVNF